MSGHGPPALARSIAQRVVPEPFRDALLGDWESMFADVCSRRGRCVAGAWYWKQVLSPSIVSLRLEARRLRNADATRSVSEREAFGPLVGTIMSDVRAAIRSLRRHPTYAFTTTMVLALGIGAATGIFSAVKSITLDPLPFDPEGRVVTLWSEGNWSPAEFVFARDRLPAMESVAAYSPGGRVLMDGIDGAEVVNTAVVTGDFFTLFGTTAASGRLPTRVDELPGSEATTVLSHDYWQRRFGADPRVVGSTVILDGTSHSVVGVAPPGFWFPAEDVEMWVTRVIDPSDGSFRFAHFLYLIGRLPGGATVDVGQDAVSSLAVALGQEFEYGEGFSKAEGASVVLLRDRATGSAREPLFVLLAAVSFLLLIACANVAGLQVNRTLQNMTELSVRRSLGASRGRVAWERFVESCVVALTGGVLGIAVASLALRSIEAVLPPDTPRTGALHVDGLALATALALSILVAILVGVLPAVLGAGSDVMSTLKERRSTGGPGPGRLRRALVVAQTGLAVVLVASAALLANSLTRLMSVPLGFEPEHVIAAEISIPPEYTHPLRIDATQGVIDRLSAIPGIESVGGVQRLPLMPGWSFGIEAEGSSVEDGPGGAPWRSVLPGYFESVGMAVTAGRSILPGDGPGSPMVTVVNERLAEVYWPGLDPIGRRIRTTLPGAEWLTVVGTVENSRVTGLTEETPPAFYQPYAQAPTSSTMHFVVRSESPTSALAPAIRSAVEEVDGRLAVAGIQSLDEVIARATQQERGLALLMGGLALTSLLLGALGLFGVVSHVAAQRKSEIGLRLTLGSSRRGVVGLVLREGLVLGVAGVVAGLAMTIPLTRLLESSLYGVRANDLPTMVGVVTALIATTVLAAGGPAVRVSRLDPARTLHQE